MRHERNGSCGQRGKPWQRHHRPPLVATGAGASGVLLIRPCKHPGKTFEDWTKLQSKLPFYLFLSFSLSPLVLSTVPDTRSPTMGGCVKQFVEWKCRMNARWKGLNVYLQCIVDAAAQRQREEPLIAGPPYEHFYATDAKRSPAKQYNPPL